MPYSNQLLDIQGPLRPADIFAQRWRVWSFVRTILTFLEANLIWALLVALWNFQGLQSFVALNKRAPALSWRVYLQFATLDTFEQDFCHAWHEHLSLMGNVIQVRIFVGKDSYVSARPLRRQRSEDWKRCDYIRAVAHVVQLDAVQAKLWRSDPP